MNQRSILTVVDVVIQVWFQNKRSKERRLKQLTSMGLRPYFGASRKLRGFPVSPGMDDGSGVGVGVGGFNPYFDPKYATEFSYGGAPGPHPSHPFNLHPHPGHPSLHHPNAPFGDFFGPPPPPQSAQGGPPGPPGANQGPAGNPSFAPGPGQFLLFVFIRFFFHSCFQQYFHFISFHQCVYNSIMQYVWNS